MKSVVLCNLLLPVAGEAAGLITQAMSSTGTVFMSAGKSVVDKAMATKKKLGQSCKLRDCEDPWICWGGKCQECQPDDDIIGLTCPLPKQCMKIAQAPFQLYMGCYDPATYMDCGGHVAKTCSECAQNDKSEQFCNGDCEWKSSGCVAKATTLAPLSPLFKAEKTTKNCDALSRDLCDVENRDCYWWTSNVENAVPVCKSLKELRERPEIVARKFRNFKMGSYMDSDVEAEDAEKGVCDISKYSWYTKLKNKTSPFGIEKLKKECGNIKAGLCIWKSKHLGFGDCVPRPQGERTAQSNCDDKEIAKRGGCICVSKSKTKSSKFCDEGFTCNQEERTLCTAPPCAGDVNTFSGCQCTSIKKLGFLKRTKTEICGANFICNASDKKTLCTISTICAENYFVMSNVCTACPTGTFRPAGDDIGGGDTICGPSQEAVADQSAVRNEHYNEHDHLHHSHNDHDDHGYHTSGSQSEHSTEQGQNPPQIPEGVEKKAPSPDVQPPVNALANQPQALQTPSSPSNNSDGPETSVNVVASLDGDGGGVLKENGSLMPVSRHNI